MNTPAAKPTPGPWEARVNPSGSYGRMVIESYCHAEGVHWIALELASMVVYGGIGAAIGVLVGIGLR